MIEVKQRKPDFVVQQEAPIVNVAPASVTIAAPEIRIPPAQIQVIKSNCVWRFDAHYYESGPLSGKFSHIIATPQQKDLT